MRKSTSEKHFLMKFQRILFIVRFQTAKNVRSLAVVQLVNPVTVCTKMLATLLLARMASMPISLQLMTQCLTLAKVSRL